MLDPNGAPLSADTAAASASASAAPLNGQASSNGNGHGPRDASFWQRSLDEAALSETTWHPPLPAHHSSRQAVAGLLDELASAHSAAGWGGEAQPYQAWYLRWFFETRAQAAQHELEDVLAEVRASARSYASLLQDARATSALSRQTAQAALRGEESLAQMPEITLEALLARARHDFTSAAALAGLYVETSPGAPQVLAAAPAPITAPARFRRRGKADEPSVLAAAPVASSEAVSGHISPRLVEAALEREAPSVPEIAGMHHLRYPQAEWHGEDGEGSGGLRRALASLSSTMLSMAPLVLGLMVALCLGSVSGLLDIEDLTRRPDAAKIFKFVLAVLLGGVVVSVLGKGMESTIRSLFDHLSSTLRPPPAAGADEEGFKTLRAFRAHTPPSPRRRRLIVGGCLALLVAFAIAEAVAEGTGLKTLNDLRVANMSQLQQRQYNASPIALWIFYLIGVLFSGAYLYYKGTDTWRRSELEAMRPWLARQRQEWFEEKRREPQVQELFQLAYLIEQMEAKRDELRRRLDNARLSAVAEAELLHAMLEWVVYSHGAMPMPTLHMVKGFGLNTSSTNGTNGTSNGSSASSNGAAKGRSS